MTCIPEEQKRNFKDVYESILNENVYSENAIAKCSLLEKQEHKTTKIKLVYDTVKQAFENREQTLSNDAYGKLERMFLINEAAKCKNFSNGLQNDHDFSFLGVTDKPKCELSDSEKLVIRNFVEAKLREKINSFTERYYSLGGNKDVPRNIGNVNSKISYQNDELVLFNSKRKIDEVYTGYEKELKTMLQLLTEWSELKSTLIKDHLKNTEGVLIEAELAEIQIIIGKLSCQLRMFLETPATISAFRILKSNLDTKIQQVDNEIIKKTNLKKEYEDLKCTEYDEILRKYTDICNAIKKRNIFFNKL